VLRNRFAARGPDRFHVISPESSSKIGRERRLRVGEL
jgi:hypothetical protein